MRHLSLTVIAMLLASCLRAAEVPSIVKEGFDALKEKGAAGAFEVWLRGSALQGDTTTKVNTIGGMTQIEAAYGKFDSYEIIGAVSVTARLQRIYAVMYYGKGPVFAYFDLFKADKDWVAYMFQVHTKPQEILPRELLVKIGLTSRPSTTR